MCDSMMSKEASDLIDQTSSLVVVLEEWLAERYKIFERKAAGLVTIVLFDHARSHTVLWR